MLRVYSRRVLNLNGGERALVANGRLLGPMENDEPFTIEDFALLERFSFTTYLEKIQKALEKSSDDDEGTFMKTSKRFRLILLFQISRVILYLKSFLYLCQDLRHELVLRSILVVMNIQF